MINIDYRWHTVKHHGSPNSYNCPYGFRWRDRKLTIGINEGIMLPEQYHALSDFDPEIMWQPLPPIIEEEVPIPPKTTWLVDKGWIKPDSSPIIESEVKAACDNLNKLEETGIVIKWRNWQECTLVDKTPILAKKGNKIITVYGEDVRIYRYPWVPFPDNLGDD